MIQFESLKEAYTDALRGDRIDKAQEFAIASGDLRRIYLFAKYTPGAEIDRFQDVVIRSGDPV